MKIDKRKKVFVIFGDTDMRLHAKGLSNIVKELTKGNSSVSKNAMIRDGAYFVFCGKMRRMIKILYWDKTGFCLWSKRLSAGRYPWPYEDADLTPTMAKQIRALLNGIDVMDGTNHIY